MAAEAVRRGHTVTCASRGFSGSVPEGARLLVLDRSAAGGAAGRDALVGGAAGRDALVGGAAGPDAVVDVARIPSWVRAAVAAYPDAHWVFVSTISVYADVATPGGSPQTLRLLDPVDDDLDPGTSPATSGAMKVGCERAVAGAARSWWIVRPGLVVDPDDPTGRFS